MTRGGADLTLSISDESIAGFTVNAKAFIKDADVKIDKVYCKVRSTEEVTARDVDLARDENGSVIQVREDVQHSEITFQQEFVVTGGETLSSGQEYNWSTNIELPSSVWPTYQGRNAQHRWEVFVGLDAMGNDPDTGWVQLELYA